MTESNIQSAKSYSEKSLADIRGVVGRVGLPSGSLVIAVGSLARREASPQSDIDYFVLVETAGERDILPEISAEIAKLGLKAPSPTGAFARVITIAEFLEKIGGNSESNDDLTRRMLFLLESDWLFGKERYDQLFDEVVALYIREGITQHQLARFFLNDLIRYYRTICVDFEYKTVNAGKSWGDRNVKLMFSRKLLYFSGLLAAAETAQSACEFKRSKLKGLLRMTPLDRVAAVCGDGATRILGRYNDFLGWMADEKVRDLLKGTCSARAGHSDEFRAMKNAGHHFSWDLEALFHHRYAPTHPINQALIF